MLKTSCLISCQFGYKGIAVLNDITTLTVVEKVSSGQCRPVQILFMTPLFLFLFYDLKQNIEGDYYFRIQCLAQSNWQQWCRI